MQPLTAASLGKAVVTLVCGVLVGAVGTVMHRAALPWGLVGALALALVASLTARAWAGWVTWIGYLGGLFFSVQAMAQSGPGGDVMVPAGEPIGWVWVIGSLVLALATGVLPGRLFTDHAVAPVRSSGPATSGPASSGPATPGSASPGPATPSLASPPPDEHTARPDEPGR